jgi:hypothetical protein
MKILKAQTSLALAAALLLAGVAAASAAGMASSNSSQNGSAAMKMSKPASDTLTLSSAQQNTAWKDLNAKSLNQTAPSGFNAAVGAVMPNGVQMAPVTRKAAGDVPALKPYNFAMLQHKLLIVNPSDKKIAEVITH